MSLRRVVVPGLLFVALLVTSVGWARSASEAPSVGEIDRCRWDDASLVLSFGYGADEEVSPVLDTRDGDLVVWLETRSGDGPAPAILLSGEATFSVFNDPGGKVLRPDGSELVCR